MSPARIVTPHPGLSSLLALLIMLGARAAAAGPPPPSAPAGPLGTTPSGAIPAAPRPARLTKPDTQQPPPPRAVLLLYDGLDAERFLGLLASRHYPLLRGWGAAGLMNPAVRRPATSLSAFLTLGAGERTGAAESGQPTALATALFEGSTAAQVYARRMGALHAGADAYVLGWAQLLGSRPPDAASARPGLLVDTLEAGGARIVYFGPVSVAGRLPAPGVLASCDGRGMLRITRPLPTGGEPSMPPPAGMPELLVYDMSNSPRAGAEERALGQAEHLANSLSPHRDLLVLASASPGAGSAWDRLCPVLIWGEPWAGRTPVSASTRTPGLVANIDVAPTLLDHFGVPAPAAMGGHAARAAPSQDLAHLAAYAHQTRVNRRAFVPVLVLWGAYALAAAGLAVAGLRPGGTIRMQRLARGALGSIATVPLAMLIAGGFFFFSAHNLVYFTGAAAAALCLACWAIGRQRSPLWVVYLVTTVALCADVASGGRRVALALLSDFPVTGMRFYGVGNEYMGVLLGVGLMLVPWLFELRRRTRLGTAGWIAAIVVWLVTILVIGWPGLGANFGGALAAVVGAYATARLCAGARLGARDLALGSALVIACAALLFWADAHRPAAEQTHLGDLARGMKGDGAGLAAVIRRKAEMNLRLLTAVPFIASLVGVAPVLLLWYHGAGARSIDALRSRPLLAAGIGGTLIGAVAALLLNDSGVVPWGLMTAAALAAWLDTLLDERIRERPPGAPA
jgi:hypothetical protein